MIHLYYGDGKGKTTAAAGLALRALGAGWRVCFVQFLKDGSSGEAAFLAALPGATVLADTPPVKFTFRMDDAEKAASRREHDANLRRALATVGAAPGPGGPAPEAALPDLDIQEDFAAGRGPWLLVLDEALDALAAGLLDDGLLRAALAWAAASETCELVVTGHSVPGSVLDAADYVTRMQAERHPYAHGAAARRGVEY